MDLPEAKDAQTIEIASEQKKVIINMRDTGEILIDDHSYNLADLSHILSKK